MRVRLSVLIALLMTGFWGSPAAQGPADSTLDQLLESAGPSPSAASAPTQPNANAPSAPKAQSVVPAPNAVTPEDSAKAAPNAPEAPLSSIPVADENQPRHASSNRLIEEIIVTAQKREENIQNVPISITAFSAQALDAKGVTSAADLPLVTPGLTLSTSVNFLTVFLRGLGSDAYLVADPSVASYVDGIYFPFSNGAIQDFGAVERIEVLKGPQGTLFGRNTIGGAINVITKAPDLNKSEISTQNSFSEHDAFFNRIYASTPFFGNTVALSTSLIYNTAHDYVEGTADGAPLQKDRTQAARIKARWRPSEWLDTTVTFLRVHQEGAGSDYAPNAAPSPLGTLLGITPQNPYAGAENEPVSFHHDNITFYGQTNISPGPIDIRLLGGHENLKSFSNYDFDGSPQPLVFFQIEPGGAKVNSGEIQVLSNDETWGAQYFKWIVGGYYFESDAGFPHAFARVASTDLATGTVFGVQLPASFVSELNSALAGSNLPLPNGEVDLVGTLETKSESGFFQGTLNITDWLAMTAGARYEHDNRYIIQSSAGLRNFNGTVTPLLYFSGETDPTYRDVHSSIKPKVAFEFRPTFPWLGEDAPLLYASWQEAIKGSSFNVVNITSAPDYVKPEKLDAYEAGIKTHLFDGLMTFNAAVFEYELRNPQVQFLSLLKGGVISFENAGRENIRGGEFDTTIRLLPSLTDGLVLALGGTFLDPIYTSYLNGTGYNEQTGILQGDLNFTGNQVVRSPRFSGTASLSQAITIRGGPVEVALDYFHQSKIFFLAQNSPFSEQTGYGVLGAHVSYLYEPWNLRITAFGKNIANTRYASSLVLTDFGRNEAAAPPAIYGIRLNFDY